MGLFTFSLSVCVYFHSKQSFLLNKKRKKSNTTTTKKYQREREIMGPCYSFVLTARTRLLTLIRSFFIFFSIVFVVVPSTPDGDAASHLLYKCVVPLFFSTHFFIGSVFLFVYFLSFAVPWVGNREQNFQNWFFPFFCCCCMLLFKGDLFHVATVAVVGSYFIPPCCFVCVYYQSTGTE